MTQYLELAIAIGATLALLVGIVVVLWNLQILRYLLRRQLVILEVTPPAFSPRSAAATKHFFSLLHGLYRSRPLRQRLLGRLICLSLEIVASREAGIRYRIVLEKHWADTVKHAMQSYMNGAQISVAPYVPANATPTVTSYRQRGHFAFPLAALTNVEEHDPVAYLASAMENLKPGEEITFQLALTPIRSREALSLSASVLRNNFQVKQFGGSGTSGTAKVGAIISGMLFAATDTFSELVHTSSKYAPSYSYNYQAYDQQKIARNEKPHRQLSAFEQQLMQSVHDKLAEPLFHVGIRVGYTGIATHDFTQRSNAVTSALAAFDNSHYQGLRPFRLHVLEKYRAFVFTRRLPSLLKRERAILSTSELSALYHFPLGSQSRADNLVTSLSKTLPAPISFKGDKKFDVILGANVHRGEMTPIGLTADERARHMFIVGGTGSGKTTMLQYQIVQDIQNGKGVAIIDPHGDMAETILRHIPEKRTPDIIYFNPDDLAYPIGLNLLELTPGLTGDELLREKDLITESVVSIFRKIFSEDDSGGYRIEYVLRNTVQTALTVKDATLFTIFRLLNSPKYRKQVVAKLEDEDLKDFWRHELGKAGEMQRVKMAAGITAKIGRFLFSASARRILEQPKSTIDFDDIINSGKVLVCNFSKGLLGEDTSELLGITILAKLQLASLRRARQQQTKRRPFYIYVDEFQNFATPSFAQMLSEARKYKMFLTMAEQSTSQQDDQQMVNVILANVGTVICFRTGNPRDEQLLLPLFSPYIEQGEITNLPPFNFYAKLSAARAQEPLSGSTLLLGSSGDAWVTEQVITSTRERYAIHYQPSETTEVIEPTQAKTQHTHKKSTVMLDQ